MAEDFGPLIVQWYLDRLGAGEEPPGSNRGPVPDAAYRYVHDGADPAKASVDDRQWCAEAYCLAVHTAGVNDGPKTAGTGAIYDFLSHKRRVIYVPRPVRHNKITPLGDSADALPGDAGLILDDTTHTGFRHTVCLVEQVDETTWRCVAGNEEDHIAFTERLVSDMVIVRAYED